MDIIEKYTNIRRAISEKVGKDMLTLEIALALIIDSIDNEFETAKENKEKAKAYEDSYLWDCGREYGAENCKLIIDSILKTTSYYDVVKPFRK